MGRLSAPYGVKGWLKVQSYAASPDSLSEHSRWWVHVESEWVCLEVEDSRVQHQGLIAKLVGFENREQVIKHLFGMGVTVTINQTLAADTAEYLVKEFGHNPIRETRIMPLSKKGRINHLSFLLVESINLNICLLC